MLILLSDFGLQDVYVGVMKGAIARINPSLVVVDLTHSIPPQNIAAGRFALMNACSYFPEGTVHVAVVDPGVGSGRRGVVVEFAGGFLVGPDNGLFSGVLSLFPAIAAFELTNTEYWLTPTPSSTFHGRDIFAPVGAHIAGGVSPTVLGDKIDVKSLVSLSLPECEVRSTGILGYIQYVDYFGNLITNIPGVLVQGKSWFVRVGNEMIPGSYTYSDRPPGAILALVGSHGWVEVAVNCGNAKLTLQLDWLDQLVVVFG
ncbi:MAG: SAM-dependent chlorinase/fluorinase [Prochloron sp. SP5CPC1]|nr:SAM-dependent chlorinase/fluorinase [Candidatus Paraprochloron terpiosi SP5CPC1]